MPAYKKKSEVFRWPLNQGTTTITSFVPINVSTTNTNVVCHSAAKWADSTKTGGEHAVDIWIDKVSATNAAALQATVTLGVSTTNRSFHIITTTPNAPYKVFDRQVLGPTDKVWFAPVSTTNDAFIVRGYAGIWE